MCKTQVALNSATYECASVAELAEEVSCNRYFFYFLSLYGIFVYGYVCALSYVIVQLFLPRFRSTDLNTIYDISYKGLICGK